MKTKNKSKKKTIKENHTKKQWQLLATRMYRRNLKNDLVIRQLAEDITQKNFTIKRLEKNYESEVKTSCSIFLIVKPREGRDVTAIHG